MQAKSPIYKYVQFRLQYLKRQNSKKNQTQESAQNEAAETVEIDDEAMKNELFMLKSMVINTHNLKEIERKIQITSKCRSQMLKDIHLDILTEFPYLFSHGELVRVFLRFLLLHVF